MDRIEIEKISKALADETRLRIFEAISANHRMNCGDIVSMRGYRMGSGGGTAPVKPEGVSELMYQIRLFHSFMWASGGVFSDYYIHQIDELSFERWPLAQ